MAAEKKSPKKAAKKPAPRVQIQNVVQILFKNTQGQTLRALVGPSTYQGRYDQENVKEGEVLVIAACGDTQRFKTDDLKKLFELLFS